MYRKWRPECLQNDLPIVLQKCSLLWRTNEKSLLWVSHPLLNFRDFYSVSKWCHKIKINQEWWSTFILFFKKSWNILKANNDFLKKILKNGKNYHLLSWNFSIYVTVLTTNQIKPFTHKKVTIWTSLNITQKRLNPDIAETLT